MSLEPFKRKSLRDKINAKPTLGDKQKAEKKLEKVLEKVVNIKGKK